MTDPGMKPRPVSGDPTIDMVLERTPPRVMKLVRPLLTRWPGRVGLRVAAATIRIEIFDRSMTIAAQTFTSVFPVLIVLASFFEPDDNDVAEAINLPVQSSALMESLVSTTPEATFGIVGAVIVLASATSLSRALTRAYAAIWRLPRPRSKLNKAWRWLAVVVGIALALIATQALSRYAADHMDPPNVWGVLIRILADIGLGLFVPWVLLEGVVPPRRLLPGALIFAGVMMLVRPASEFWLPLALDASADKYGSIGVAFTYLAWLYVVAFCFLGTAIIGEVIVNDEGWLGRLLRGKRPLPSLSEALALGVDDPPE